MCMKPKNITTVRMKTKSVLTIRKPYETYFEQKSMEKL